jgi:hypothetical protein
VTVRVINTDASRNKFLQSCLREICFIAAINSFDIKVRHISCNTDSIKDTSLQLDNNVRHQHKSSLKSSGIEI